MTSFDTNQSIWNFNFTKALSGIQLRPLSDVAKSGYAMGLVARESRKSDFLRGFEDGRKGLNLDIMDEETEAYHTGLRMAQASLKAPTDAAPTTRTSRPGSVLGSLGINQCWEVLVGKISQARYEALTTHYKAQSEQDQKKAIRRVLRSINKAH